MAGRDTEEEIKKLLAEMQGLKAELEKERSARTAAEAAAESMASQIFGSTAEEQATGRTVTVKMCVNPAERKEKNQIWKDIEVPTYYYRIDIPTAAGAALSSNGVEYYHGQTYEFDQMTLTDIKSRVARCWEHEKSIHGDNENAYKKPTNVTFSGKRAA